ncbi:MAG: hypothetical protein ABWK01_01510, partial [Infirmifilum sp.]
MAAIPHSISEKLSIIEEIVRAPLYSLAGLAAGHLAYVSTVEGVRDLWALDLSTGERVRLTRGGIHQVARPRPRSPYVVYTRDVSGGRELQAVYAVDVGGRENIALEGFEPRRVLGVAFDGERAALAAAGEGVELWLLDLRGGVEKLHTARGIMWVTDFQDGPVVGQGVLKGDPRSFEVFIYDLSTGGFEVYTPKEGSSNRSPVTRSGRVLFATNAFGGERLVVYEPGSRELKPVEVMGPDLEAYGPIEFVSFGWTEEGRLWAIGKRDGRARLFLDGRALPTPEGMLYDADFAGGRAYVTHTSLTTPTRILEVDKGGWRILLGSELPEEVAGRFGATRVVRVRSSDGLEIPTFVIESRAAPKPGPTVVYVHGGPWSEVADAWNVFIASLAASGYHV